VLLVSAIAMGLTACQSAPESGDMDGDANQAITSDENTEAFGAGNRADIETMGDDMNEMDQMAQEKADAAQKASAMLGTTVFYFDFDQASLQSDALDALRAHAQYLNENPNAKTRLEGHGDERGTREYNVALGERRGNAVAKYLRLNGVKGNQVEVISYGEEKPVAFGHDEQSWAANRRVELVYTAGQP